MDRDPEIRIRIRQIRFFQKSGFFVFSTLVRVVRVVRAVRAVGLVRVVRAVRVVRG